MEHTHTPGPWQIAERAKGVNQGLAIRAADDSGGAVAISLGYESDECKANASLIAAAPDLLDALESALKTADFENAPFRAWQQQARDAIAKAYCQ